MGKQVIISISREFGSGGHEIAKRIAEDLGMPMYDRNLLDHVAEARDIRSENLKAYEERPRNVIFSRHVRGFSNSIEENVAQMEFDFLRKKAENGESFVVVGRCSEVVLAEYSGLISIFVLGDWSSKADRVQRVYSLSRDEAMEKMSRHDKSRKAFHNAYSKIKWGDSRGYDVSINSSRLGIEGTVAYLEDYIQRRIALMEQEHQQMKHG